MIHFKLRYSQRKRGENLGQNGLCIVSDTFYPPRLLFHVTCSVSKTLKIPHFRRTLVYANTNKINVTLKMDLEQHAHKRGCHKFSLPHSPTTLVVITP